MSNFRKMVVEDAPLVYQWRNDPFIMKLGSLQQTVTWEDHFNWIKNTVEGNKRRAFILLKNSTPCGQIRFDAFETDNITTEDSCVVSVYLLEQYTGKGQGVQYLKEVCAAFFQNNLNIKNIYAFVRDDNAAGQKGFEKAGFQKITNNVPEYHRGYIMQRK